MHLLFSKEILDIFTSIITIIGVGFAIVIYFLWKNNYNLQKADEYAIEMLKKLHTLHGNIEAIRSPKFYFPKSVGEDLEKIFIPKINELVSEAVSIRSDFMLAKYKLIKSKSIINNFNALIVDKVIKEIRIAAYAYHDEINFKTPIHDTKLWKIIFPAECREFGKPLDFKHSVLGTKEEIVNDKFNETIESSFSSLYQLLEKELTKHTTINSLFKKIISVIVILFATYCIVSCIYNLRSKYGLNKKLRNNNSYINKEIFISYQE